jgi:DNA-binding LacI/PurR family transcriptional regulator
MAGMSSASVSLNLALLSHHVQPDECASVLEPSLQPPALRAGMVDGLVLIHRWPPEVARRLSQKYPTVSIIHHYPETSIDLIGIDERSGIASLVRHLHAAGHDRIGFFGLCREMSWSRSRFAAYVEAQVCLGLPYDPQQTISIALAEAQSRDPFPDGAWSDALRKQIQQGVRAWVCASSMTGYTLVRFAQQGGLRIPDDMAITGFHTAVAPPAGFPELTATDAVDEELGAAALWRLDYRLRHPREGNRSILLPANFVQGATTRPA